MKIEYIKIKKMQAEKLLMGTDDWNIIDKNMVQEILDKLNGQTLRPDPDDIFNAFRETSLANTKVVIIGMDPYPGTTSKGLKAHGLCFSTRYETGFIPHSLRKIYDTLQQNGFLKKTPSHGCLINWARQGILMLNAYLTTGTKAGMHKDIWLPFTKQLLEDLCEVKDKLIFLLWGTHAQKLSQYISNKHIILEWGHPSPMSKFNKMDCPRNFINCDHFKKVNELLDIPIVWDPDWNPNKLVVCFTDGHASNNGKKGAKAGYGLYCPETFCGKPNKLSGSLYGPVDGEQTNNRAELTAMIKALTTIINNGKGDHKIIIYTDSRYTQNIVNYDIWKNGWIETHANSDLTSRIHELCEKLQNNLGIKCKNGLFHPNICRDDNFNLDWPILNVRHCRSHQKRPPGNGIDAQIWDGNNEADLLSKKEY